MGIFAGASQTANAFTPTCNDFSYELQYAGKNLPGGNACWSVDAALQMGLEQIKVMKTASASRPRW